MTPITPAAKKLSIALLDPAGDIDAAAATATAAGASPSGSVTVKPNVEPIPTWLLAKTWPPMCSMRLLLMDRPRPVPPKRRVVEASAWAHSPNRPSRAAGSRSASVCQ